MFILTIQYSLQQIKVKLYSKWKVFAYAPLGLFPLILGPVILFKTSSLYDNIDHVDSILVKNFKEVNKCLDKYAAINTEKFDYILKHINSDVGSTWWFMLVSILIGVLVPAIIGGIELLKEKMPKNSHVKQE